MTKHDLSIEKMREIVAGAQPWALFYVHNREYSGRYGNHKGVCVEGCFSDSSVSLNDLRAALAEHDAAPAAEVTGHNDLIRKFHAASFDGGELAESGNYNIKLINLEDAIQILKDHGHD